MLFKIRGKEKKREIKWRQTSMMITIRHLELESLPSNPGSSTPLINSRILVCYLVLLNHKVLIDNKEKLK